MNKDEAWAIIEAEAMGEHEGPLEEYNEAIEVINNHED